MIRIVKARKENISDISKLFVEGFYDYFKSFETNKDRLIKAFKHSFILDNYYVVLLDDNVIGIGAVSDGRFTVKFNKYKLCYYLGVGLGKRIYKYLKVIFENKDYAFEMDDKCGLLEYLVVKEEYRNNGIGNVFINHLIHDNDYIRYIAKIGDNNRALHLFERIGFEEFDRERASEKERIYMGINDYLYMICLKK